MRRNLRALASYLLLLTATITAYSVLFHVIMLYEGQEHSWLTGFYWTLTVMSTLGFGDITFQSDLGRAFSIAGAALGDRDAPDRAPLHLHPLLLRALAGGPGATARPAQGPGRRARPRDHLRLRRDRPQPDRAAAGVRDPVLRDRVRSDRGRGNARGRRLGGGRRARGGGHLRGPARGRRPSRLRQPERHREHQRDAHRPGDVRRGADLRPGGEHRLGRRPRAGRRLRGAAAQAASWANTSPAAWRWALPRRIESGASRTW